ncbi:MAG: hypothetical protein ACI9WC_002901 [Arenicella sp.]
MKSQLNGIIYAIALGLFLGVTCVFFMGIVAAIVVPIELYRWLDNNQLAYYIVNFVSQLFGFGIIAISIGMLLGRLSKRWILNSLVCYAACVFYLAIGSALIYKAEISNPFSGITYFDLPAMLVLPFCLLISTYLTAKKVSARNA